MLKESEIFAAQVPRYTSYPTAPHFTAQVDATAYAGWLEALEPGAPLSLYVHVPFCDTLCWFCACHTTVVNNYGPVQDYCDRLIAELELISRHLQGRHPVTHIHWGGGSPTILSPDDMHRLNNAIRTHFDVAANAEFAVEIDPRGFDRRMAGSLAACGVTRASIGLQDCSAKVQQAINRVQSDEETGFTTYLLRESGISHINLDLVYGLPHQSSDGFDRNLDLALWLHPDRIAIFGYAHVPHFKKHQALIPEAALPDIEARMSLARQATATLCAHGYGAVGIDHFALPDDPLFKAAANRSLRRNFQGYTTDTGSALIALGASAIGLLPQGYVQNLAAVPSYRSTIDEGRLPAAKGRALTAEDRLRASVIEEIMCFLDVDVADICRRHGYPDDHLDDCFAGLKTLVEGGYAGIEGRKIRVNPLFRQAARLVAASFDAYLAPGSGRHAMTA
jgi:oxygen-independent coproporphyrinogen-3 oxidase